MKSFFVFVFYKPQKYCCTMYHENIFQCTNIMQKKDVVSVQNGGGVGGDIKPLFVCLFDSD